MTEGVIDKHRRRFLITAATVVGGGVAVLAIPFIQSLEPNRYAGTRR